MSLEEILRQINIIKIQLQILLMGQKLTIPNLPIPTKIIIHHGGGWMDFKGVNDWHRQKWGFKSSLGFFCGYQYFVERDGIIFQARADNEEGAHVKGMNKLSIGICLMGNGEEKDFTIQQYDSLTGLIERLRKKYDIPKEEIYGHKDFSATACPSNILYQRILNYKLKVA